jgi:hypothetical protein
MSWYIIMKWIVQYVQPEDISGQRRLQVLNSEIVVATGFLQRSIVSMIEMNLSKLLWVIESSCAVTTSLKNEAEERAIKAETLLHKYQNENTSLIKGRENADAEILEGCAKLLNSKKVEILKLQEDVKILSEALSTSKRECKEERTAKELSLARQLILETELAATYEGGDEDSRAMQDAESGPLDSNLRRIESGSDVTTADMILPKARKILLDYFTQPKNFLAFQAMQFLFGGNEDNESLKTIFAITQGNPCFEAKLTSKDTGVVPNCVTATTGLLATLRNLHYPWKISVEKVSDDFASEVAKGDSPLLKRKKKVIDARKRFSEDQEKRMRRYLDATIEYYKHLGISIFSENEAFDAAVAEKWRVDQMQIYTNKTAGIIMAALHEGMRAIQDAEGFKKTEECLEGLKLS